MPIRTNRGRAAVYRRLWAWPLRSPRHLVGAIVLVIVVAIGVAIAVARLHPASSTPHTPGPFDTTTTQAPSPTSSSVNTNLPPPTNANNPSTRLSTAPEPWLSARGCDCGIRIRREI